MSYPQKKRDENQGCMNLIHLMYSTVRLDLCKTKLQYPILTEYVAQKFIR